MEYLNIPGLRKTPSQKKFILMGKVVLLGRQCRIVFSGPRENIKKVQR